MNKSKDYAKALLTLVQSKDMQLKIGLEKNTENNLLVVTMSISHDKKKIYDETMSGNHFTTITQNLARNIIQKIANGQTEIPNDTAESFEIETTDETNPQAESEKTHSEEPRGKAVIDVLNIETHVDEEYFVANVEPIIVNHICPTCQKELKAETYDIPVYLTKDNFKQYYKKTLLVCNECHSKFMTLNDWNNLVYNAFTTHKNVEIKGAKNMRRRLPTDTDTRLYIPILETNIYFEESIDAEKAPFDGDFTRMKKESSLKKMGYSTKLNRVEREQILREYVKQNGLHATINFLRFLIRTQDQHPKAQKIWQSDINFLQTIDPRNTRPRNYVL